MVPSEHLIFGKRRRSHVLEAIAPELRRRRLKKAIAEMAGSLADVDVPGWESRESAATWVRSLRAGTLEAQSKEARSGEEVATSEPLAGDDVSVSVAELTAMASQLSQLQLSALIETARDQVARNTPAGFDQMSPEVGTIS